MKLTAKQLKKIIFEELIRLNESDENVQKLLDSEYPEMVMQGIDISDALGMPIVFNNAPPAKILFYIRSLDNPDLISLMINKEQFPTVLNRLATNKNLTGQMMSELIKFNSDRINLSIAENESVTVEILNMLSNSDAIRIVRAVANNLKTPAETLDRMVDMHSDDSYTLEDIFNNPNVSNETLMKGAHNPFGYSRQVAEKVLNKRGIQMQVHQDKFDTDELDFDEDDDYEF